MTDWTKVYGKMFVDEISPRGYVWLCSKDRFKKKVYEVAFFISDLQAYITDPEGKPYCFNIGNFSRRYPFTWNTAHNSIDGTDFSTAEKVSLCKYLLSIVSGER